MGDTLYVQPGDILRCVCGCADFIRTTRLRHDGTPTASGLRPAEPTDVWQCTNCRLRWQRFHDPDDDGTFAWAQVEAT